MGFGKFTSVTATTFSPDRPIMVTRTEGSFTPALPAGTVINETETINVPANGAIHYEV